MTNEREAIALVVSRLRDANGYSCSDGSTCNNADLGLYGEAADLIERLALSHPTAGMGEAPAGWKPQIGERIEVVEGYLDSELWRRTPLWVAGVQVADSGDGLNVTVTEQWPVPYRHSREYIGQTDCFYVGRANRRDDLRPLTASPEAQPAAGGVSLLRKPTTSAPAGCHCKDICGAPVIMGRQQPCRRAGGVPGQKAPLPAQPPAPLGQEGGERAITPSTTVKWLRAQLVAATKETVSLHKNDVRDIIGAILAASEQVASTPSDTDLREALK